MEGAKGIQRQTIELESLADAHPELVVDHIGVPLVIVEERRRRRVEVHEAERRVRVRHWRDGGRFEDDGAGLIPLACTRKNGC